MNKQIPLSVPNLDTEIMPMLEHCINTGWVSTGGKYIDDFEQNLARYLNVTEVIGVQSGTAALHLAYRVLNLEKGDGVLVPTVSFIATVNPITYVGATPVFIDCGEDLHIDPLKIENYLQQECYMVGGLVLDRKTGIKIRAIAVTHVFGDLADMERIMEISRRYGLFVVEDAAEALGSRYITGEFAGKYAGTVGDIGIYSFNANKIITTGGGGAFVAKNPQLRERARFLAVQAKTNPLFYVHDEIGYNYRMLNLNAALGISQLAHLEEFIKIKKAGYEKYRRELLGIEGLSLLPFGQHRANYWFYSLVVDAKAFGMDRETLLIRLYDQGIQTRPLWGLLHEQKPYRGCPRGRMDYSIYYSKTLLSLPCSTNLSHGEIEIITEELRRIARKSNAV